MCLQVLAERLETGGAMVVHVLSENRRPLVRRSATWLATRVTPLHPLARWAVGRDHWVAPMEMNTYDLDRVHRLLEQRGVQVRKVTSYEHSQMEWATLYGAK